VRELRFAWPSFTVRSIRSTAAVLAAMSCCAALAQEGAPHFAPPNLSPSGVRALAANCAPCHGTEGHAVKGSVIGGLAGRKAEELRALLLAFKNGEAPATVMQQIARGYSDDEIAALADYFAGAARASR
jgi:cytochrome subunit of sulfide dehydrogenase